MTSSNCAQLTILRGPHAGVDVRYCLSMKQNGTPSTNPSLIIGRHKTKSWLCLKDDLEVSTVHAEFRYDSISNSNSVSDCGDRWVLLDSKSTNGTRLNGHRIDSGSVHRLQSQDLILVGKSLLRFIIANDCCSNANGAITETSDCVNNLPLPIEKCEGSDPVNEKNDSTEQENINAFNVITKADFAEPRCVVCGINLSAMDFYNQNLHVNNCLDRRKSTAMTKVTGMKRKQLKVVQERKIGADVKGQTEEEEVAMALAISKSLTTVPAELDMNISLLNGELRQIESDIMALLKKRTVIVKKLEKYRRQEIKSVNSNPNTADEDMTSNGYTKDVVDDLFPPLLCTRRREWTLMQQSNEPDKPLLFSWWFRSMQSIKDSMSEQIDEIKDEMTAESSHRNDNSCRDSKVSSEQNGRLTELQVDSEQRHSPPTKKSRGLSASDQTFKMRGEEG